MKELILSQGYDGEYALIGKNTKVVKVGDKVTARYGSKYLVVGGAAPHKEGSTGYVYVQHPRGGNQERFYAGVFDMRWERVKRTFKKNPRGKGFRTRGYNPKMKRVIRRMGRRIYGKTYGHVRKPVTNATLIKRFQRAQAAHYRKNPTSIKPAGANQTELTTDDGVLVLYSYQTPVAAHVPGEGTYVTEKQWSRTTSKHVTQFMQRHGLSRAPRKMPQEWFDGLVGTVRKNPRKLSSTGRYKRSYGVDRVGPRKGMLCLQEKRGDAFITLATFKPEMKAVAIQVGKRLHRRFPSRTFRLYS